MKEKSGVKRQICKGTRDLLPQDMVKFRHIEDVFRSCCLGWGYEEVRTPTLEYLHLFTSTGTLTPDMLRRAYSFLDWDGWSGERVVLRPDGTIPIARLCADNMEKRELAKLFYVENVFSFEQTGKEARERWQCGAELIGCAKPVADAELILLALEVLGKLSMGAVEVRLSHAGLLRALLRELGLGSVEQTEVFDQILDGNVKALTEIKPGTPALERALSLLLDLKGESKGFLENLKVSLAKDLRGLVPSLDDFLRVVDLLSALGVDYQIDIASGRGFEYYTGVIFQFYLVGERIGGGGRYDDLIPLVGGRDVPASGFALYVDQLMNLMSIEGVEQPAQQRVLVRAEGGGVERLKSCFDIAHFLRGAGYVAELDLDQSAVAGLRWILLVQGSEETPSFILVDQITGRKVEVSSAAEVLKILEEAKCS